MVKEFPYLPKGKNLQFVPSNNPFLLEAENFAKEFSLDPDHPTGAVLVMNQKIIGCGENGSTFHQKNGCERKKRNMPTGEGYQLCEGCHPKNHAEQRAISHARNKHENTQGADLYLWGHWWCCESCWEVMMEAGINQVYLDEKSKELFKK